ncbi:ammonium transporter [Calderihabitans maritimus]
MVSLWGALLWFVFPGRVWAAEPTPASNALAIDTIWTLLAAFLVFLMHAGFTMVESGFTQSKNTVNIIMKNLATIAIGVIVFFAVGFGIMFGPDVGGIIGTKGFWMENISDLDFGIPTLGFWLFQAVFAATSATIVSGAVAERFKFVAYCIFTVVMTAIIYPVVGHWVWGGGWLSRLGFIDFAGSTVVHSVGGWSALVGAYLVGARLGKYGKDGSVQVIPGHNIPLGALGVFILWFGWFGFNAGSTISGTSPEIVSIATTTLLAGAAGIVGVMLITTIKYSKPDPTLTLNGALAGLVGITAGTASVSPTGALIIGLAAGIIMVFAVEYFDRVAKIDDPVGAISVHGVCGAFGTLAVGLFATEGGLFYGGGISLLVVQLIGVIAVFAWSVFCSWIVFSIINAWVGLRVSPEEEMEGLDLGEHGLRAYGDFVFRSAIPGSSVQPATQEIRMAKPEIEVSR